MGQSKAAEDEDDDPLMTAALTAKRSSGKTQESQPAPKRPRARLPQPKSEPVPAEDSGNDAIGGSAKRPRTAAAESQQQSKPARTTGPSDGNEEFCAEVNSRLREMGHWKPGERTDQKLARLTSHIVREVMAAQQKPAEAENWAAQLLETLSKMLGAEKAQDFGAWLGERMLALQRDTEESTQEAKKAAMASTPAASEPAGGVPEGAPSRQRRSRWSDDARVPETKEGVKMQGASLVASKTAAAETASNGGANSLAKPATAGAAAAVAASTPAPVAENAAAARAARAIAKPGGAVPPVKPVDAASTWQQQQQPAAPTPQAQATSASSAVPARDESESWKKLREASPSKDASAPWNSLRRRAGRKSLGTGDTVVGSDGNATAVTASPAQDGRQRRFEQHPMAEPREPSKQVKPVVVQPNVRPSTAPAAKNYQPPPVPTSNNQPGMFNSYQPPPTNKGYAPAPTQSYTPPPTQSYVPPPSQSHVSPPTQSYVPPPTQNYTPPPTQSYVPAPTSSYVPAPTRTFQAAPKVVAPAPRQPKVVPAPHAMSQAAQPHSVPRPTAHVVRPQTHASSMDEWQAPRPSSQAPPKTVPVPSTKEVEEAPEPAVVEPPAWQHRGRTSFPAGAKRPKWDSWDSWDSWGDDGDDYDDYDDGFNEADEQAPAEQGPTEEEQEPMEEDQPPLEEVQASSEAVQVSTWATVETAPQAEAANAVLEEEVQAPEATEVPSLEAADVALQAEHTRDATVSAVPQGLPGPGQTARVIPPKLRAAAIPPIETGQQMEATPPKIKAATPSPPEPKQKMELLLPGQTAKATPHHAAASEPLQSDLPQIAQPTPKTIPKTGPFSAIAPKTVPRPKEQDTRVSNALKSFSAPAPKIVARPKEQAQVLENQHQIAAPNPKVAAEPLDMEPAAAKATHQGSSPQTHSAVEWEGPPRLPLHLNPAMLKARAQAIGISLDDPDEADSEAGEQDQSQDGVQQEPTDSFTWTHSNPHQENQLLDGSGQEQEEPNVNPKAMPEKKDDLVLNPKAVPPMLNPKAVPALPQQQHIPKAAVQALQQPYQQPQQLAEEQAGCGAPLSHLTPKPGQLNKPLFHGKPLFTGKPMQWSQVAQKQEGLQQQKQQQQQQQQQQRQQQALEEQQQQTLGQITLEAPEPPALLEQEQAQTQQALQQLTMQSMLLQQQQQQQVQQVATSEQPLASLLQQQLLQQQLAQQQLAQQLLQQRLLQQQLLQQGLVQQAQQLAQISQTTAEQQPQLQQQQQQPQQESMSDFAAEQDALVAALSQALPAQT